MKIKFIEAVHSLDRGNWGKFAVERYDSEWELPSAIDGPGSLLKRVGWSPRHIWVKDLQTGEGAFFRPGGHAGADLNRHRIWTCPLFLPFLEWLYRQDLADLGTLPSVVELPDAPFDFRGYRREGLVMAGYEDLRLLLNYTADNVYVPSTISGALVRLRGDLRRP